MVKKNFRNNCFYTEMNSMKIVVEYKLNKKFKEPCCGIHLKNAIPKILKLPQSTKTVF